MGTTVYVCGFAFSDERVLLTRKSRPEWQKGRLNGLGGHIESGETAGQSMVREFKEESGIQTFEGDWDNFCELHGKDFLVEFFRASLSLVVLSAAMLRSRKEEWEEPLVVKTWRNVHEFEAIPNLTWLLPMAVNLDKEISPNKTKKLILTEVYE